MPKTLLSKTKFMILLAVLMVVPSMVQKAAAQDLTGLEIIRMARLANGGREYKGLQYLTARAQGFVNMAPIAGAGLGSGPAAAAVEVKLNLVDYQDADTRRRLDVSPTNPAMVALGPSFLVYTGTSGGGMYMGNEFRVSEATATRHWGLMGFATLNRAADGNLTVVRQHDDGGSFVVEVKFNSADTVRYYIDKTDFTINKVTTRYNSTPVVEELRGDYRKVGCMWLPFHIVTKLNGQRLADLDVDSYDLETVVPAARFTMTATPN